MVDNLFAKRRLLIATQHHKEQVIAPILEQVLDVNCEVIADLDTDVLGTFSGEVERKDDPITTLRNKCLMALDQTGGDLVVASEGSFGPHPQMFFMSADDELVMLIDKKHNLEILARALSIDTNFNGKEVTSESDLLAFAEAVKFPSHGLILRKAQGEKLGIVKGIKDIEKLKHCFNSFLEQYGSAFVETDMRAMHNPSRMKVIEAATHNLVKKLSSCCPQCEMPGFDIVKSNPGLQCAECGLPTQSILNHVYICQHCHYEQMQMHPANKTTADPRYCDFCNP